MWFVILLGIIAFFIFEMPVVFFLVVLPVSLLLLLGFIGWLKK